MEVSLQISARKLSRMLLAVILFLTLASTAGLFIVKYFGGTRHAWLLEPILKFYLSAEGNIPTWYAASTLLVCSILLAAIASARKQCNDRYALHWGVMAFIFLCLSIDEAAMLHEMTILPLRHKLHLSGFLYFSWVILGAAFVLLFFLAYLRFLIALPARTRQLFLIAGTLYVGGALGIESIGGNYAAVHGMGNFTYAMISSLEEFLEMLGILVFIYGLLSHMSYHVKQVLVHFEK